MGCAGRLALLVRSVTNRRPLGATLPAAVVGCLLLPGPARPDAAQPPARPAADGSDWPMAAKDYANTRFSPLDQISTETVKNLRPAWTFDTGIHRGQEAAPVVVGDTMYVVAPWPNDCTPST